MTVFRARAPYFQIIREKIAWSSISEISIDKSIFETYLSEEKGGESEFFTMRFCPLTSTNH